MHLLIVGLNFAPELTGIGKYTGEMAAWFAGRGHRVTVITAPPYYPSWRIAPGYRGWAWRGETWQGCSITRCPLYVPRRVSALRRILHLGSFALSSMVPAIHRALGGKPDVVLAVAPALLAAPIALMAGRLAAARTWLHVQDLEIEAAFELGILGNRRVMDEILAAERRLLGKFDLVSSISPRMVEAIGRKGVPADRLMLLPNWVDASRIFPLAEARTQRHEFGLPGQGCVVLYSGSMGQKQGLEIIIDAARECSSLPGESPFFVLAGDGPARQRLEAMAQGLPNVMFLPLQPDEQFNRLLNIADIHLLPQRRDAADLVMPSKLGAIFAVGKPVIATVPAGSQIAAAVGTAGIVVPPEEPRALAAAVRELAGAPDRRERMGRAALGIAARWEAGVVLEAAEERLLQLCRPAPAGTARLAADRPGVS